MFRKIQGIPSGIRGNFCEFPEILWNSLKLSGIPLFKKNAPVTTYLFFHTTVTFLFRKSHIIWKILTLQI